MNERNRENGLQLGGKQPQMHAREQDSSGSAPLAHLRPTRSMLHDYMRTFSRHRRAVGLCALGGLMDRPYGWPWGGACLPYADFAERAEPE